MDGLSGLSMGSLYQSNRIDRAATKLIDHKDKDGDGLLNAVEFGGPPEQFDRMDANGDGQADKEAIIAFMPRPLFNGLAAMMIHQQDTDDNKTLNMDELGVSEEVFNEIDKNQGSEIDRKELGHFLSRASGRVRPPRSDRAKSGDANQPSTDDETDTGEETTSQIDTDQDGHPDTEQVTTYFPQLNIYQTTTTLLANLTNHSTA